MNFNTSRRRSLSLGLVVNPCATHVSNRELDRVLLLYLLLDLSFFLFSFNFPASADPIRIVTANLTSGNRQSYDPGEGIRIFQAFKLDVVLIQEWNYKDCLS